MAVIIADSMKRIEYFFGDEEKHAGVCPCCDTDKFRILSWKDLPKVTTETASIIELKCEDCNQHKSVIALEAATKKITNADRAGLIQIDEAVESLKSEIQDDYDNGIVAAREKVLMSLWVDRFSSALRFGHILPEDF